MFPQMIVNAYGLCNMLVLALVASCYAIGINEPNPYKARPYFDRARYALTGWIFCSGCFKVSWFAISWLIIGATKLFTLAF